MTLSPRLEADVRSALAFDGLPEFWDVNDDACDCMYVRIGMWTNPYLGETLEVRMCCIWADIYKQYPDFVRVTPAFKHYGINKWVPEIAEWNGEADMPRALWYRQLARQQDRPLPAIRADYADREPPKGKPRPQPRQKRRWWQW